jgi:hypothetical protein
MSGVTSRHFFALQQSGGNTRHHYNIVFVKLQTLFICSSK